MIRKWISVGTVLLIILSCCSGIVVVAATGNEVAKAMNNCEVITLEETEIENCSDEYNEVQSLM